MNVLALMLVLGSAPPALVELLPEGATAQERLPVVIALHGRGGDARGFGKLTLRLAGRARVISLQAPEPFARGFSWFDLRLGEPDPRLGTAIAGQVAQVRARIAAALSQTPACGLPVVVGYSQGGALALGLAASGMEAAQYVVLAGALPPGYPAQELSAKVVALHATDDALVPFALAQKALERLEEAGAEVTLRRHRGGHSPGEAMRRDAAAALQAALEEACPSRAPAAR